MNYQELRDKLDAYLEAVTSRRTQRARLGVMYREIERQLRHKPGDSGGERVFDGKDPTRESGSDGGSIPPASTTDDDEVPLWV